jgi:membrane-associated phospholipid phosphatase
VYGVADFLAHYRSTWFVPTFRIEENIPFIPELSIFYVSLYPLMGFSILLFQKKDFRILFLLLSSQVLIAGVIFLSFPTLVSYPTNIQSGGTSHLFRFADTLNLTYNSLPSLHVAFAYTIARYYCRSLSPLFAAAVILWAAGIICSTLLLHQHHLLDVFAGVILARIAEIIIIGAQGAWHHSVPLLRGK